MTSKKPTQEFLDRVRQIVEQERPVLEALGSDAYLQPDPTVRWTLSPDTPAVDNSSRTSAIEIHQQRIEDAVDAALQADQAAQEQTADAWTFYAIGNNVVDVIQGGPVDAPGGAGSGDRAQAAVPHRDQCFPDLLEAEWQPIIGAPEFQPGDPDDDA